MYAENSTSGMTAACGPKVVVETTRPAKVVPMRLSIVMRSPVRMSPRAWWIASRALTCVGRHQSRRRVDPHRRLGLDRRDEARLERDRGQADEAVAAHRAVALVVHEDHAEVGAGRHRRRQQAPVHVGVPARLPHQRLAHVVQPLAREPPPREDRRALERRHAAGHDQEWLTRRVGVDGGQDERIKRGRSAH
jgi:hypothetical protein